MLEKIFGSELKVKIIDLFLSQEELKCLSVLEISRKLGLRGSVWQKELKELSDLSLLIIKEDDLKDSQKEEKAKKLKKNTNKGLYALNKDFFLLSEIKALLAKTKILLSYKIFKEMESTCSPKLLILTGKFINKNDSLLDLLIVGNINRRNFLKLISDLEQTMNEEINYSIMTEEEFKYRRYVMDIFLYNIINYDPLILFGNLDELNLIKKESDEKREVKD